MREGSRGSQERCFSNDVGVRKRSARHHAGAWIRLVGSKADNVQILSPPSTPPTHHTHAQAPTHRWHERRSAIRTTSSSIEKKLPRSPFPSWVKSVFVLNPSSSSVPTMAKMFLCANTASFRRPMAMSAVPRRLVEDEEAWKWPTEATDAEKDGARGRMPVPKPTALPTNTFADVLEKERELPPFASKGNEAKLPPLQSVVELTNALQRPMREGEGEGDLTMALQQPLPPLESQMKRAEAMEDGSGVAEDGSQWKRESGVERGDHGYVRRWTRVSGKSADGVPFEESWWSATDARGLKAMGADKRGGDTTGRTWREAWEETLHPPSAKGGAAVIEKWAHKWCKPGEDLAADAEEDDQAWEESWFERHRANGATERGAYKTGQKGNKAWHARWGELWDGKGRANKWTDQWDENEDGSKQGDKWEEDFGPDGRGSKHGETWHAAADGTRWAKWWSEDHLGDGIVQKRGHSTSGEHWDVQEHQDTWFESKPHFGFDLAMAHSRVLMDLKEPPEELGPGTSDL